MKKELVDEHLIYILKKTTPYQRMVWLKRAFEFWKNCVKKRKCKARKNYAPLETSQTEHSHYQAKR